MTNEFGSGVLTNEKIGLAYSKLPPAQKLEIDELIKRLVDGLDERVSVRDMETKLRGKPQGSRKVGLARVGALEVIAKLGILLVNREKTPEKQKTRFLDLGLGRFYQPR